LILAGGGAAFGQRRPRRDMQSRKFSGTRRGFARILPEPFTFGGFRAGSTAGREKYMQGFAGEGAVRSVSGYFCHLNLIHQADWREFYNCEVILTIFNNLDIRHFYRQL